MLVVLLAIVEFAQGKASQKSNHSICTTQTLCFRELLPICFVVAELDGAVAVFTLATFEIPHSPHREMQKLLLPSCLADVIGHEEEEVSQQTEASQGHYQGEPMSSAPGWIHSLLNSGRPADRY